MAEIGEKALRAVAQNSSSYRWALRAVAATLLVLAAVTPTAAKATYVSTLVPFLLKQGEMGRFLPGKTQVFRTVTAVRNAAGESPARSQVQRYETEGFAEGAMVRIHNRREPAAQGVSSVFAFETANDAKAEMKAALAEQLEPVSLREPGLPYFHLRRFKVPGVPAAVAFELVTSKAADKLGVESGIAKAIFTERSCLFEVGVLRPGSKEVAEPVSSGVQAISERVGGACP
jgi:hypothetical protein